MALGLACAFTFTLASASPARADEPGQAPDGAADARAQYQAGMSAFQAKRYAEAAAHFEAAAALRTSGIALFTAGLAWDLASRPDLAADDFHRALEAKGIDAKQQATAKERLAQLEKTLATVVVTGPEGTKVAIDAATEVGVPARLHALSGQHSLVVHPAGKPLDPRDINLEAGTITNVDLTTNKDAEPEHNKVVSAATGEPVTVAQPTPPPFWNTRRVAGMAVGGASIAALGGALVLGLSANGAKDAYEAGPTRAAYDHASSLQTWTNVALIGGIALLAGGVALVVWPDGSREGKVRATATGNGVLVQGSF